MSQRRAIALPSPRTRTTLVGTTRSVQSVAVASHRRARARGPERYALGTAGIGTTKPRSRVHRTLRASRGPEQDGARYSVGRRRATCVQRRRGRTFHFDVRRAGNSNVTDSGFRSPATDLPSAMRFATSRYPMRGSSVSGHAVNHLASLETPRSQCSTSHRIQKS